MPGGGGRDDESPMEASVREFLEETGHDLISDENWVTGLEDGHVYFGFIGEGKTEKRRKNEIIEVGMFRELPEDLAYPSVEYLPLIEMGRKLLTEKV